MSQFDNVSSFKNDILQSPQQLFNQSVPNFAGVPQLTEAMDSKDLVNAAIIFNLGATNITAGGNVIAITNVQFQESDDSGFATFNVVPAKRINGDITADVADGGFTATITSANAGYFINTAGVIDPKRFLRVSYALEWEKVVPHVGEDVLLSFTTEELPNVTPPAS